MNDWQPIETAPKDGTHIILFWPQSGRHPTRDGYRVEEARWFSKEECIGGCRYWEPAFVSIGHNAVHHIGMTHWMRLPKPPDA
jgi:hypothetical protein